VDVTGSGGDRAQLADFVRTRREALQPEDVGLPRGPRRRTGGLRREEVAALSGMSADYLSRIEQQRGPRPSEQMLVALARALRLSTDERDHLFRLGGFPAPARGPGSGHVDPGLMLILDRLRDTPAMVLSGAGEVLAQTASAAALFGPYDAGPSGLGRSVAHRWYTDPASREVYPEEDRDQRGREFTADLRYASTRDGAGSRAAAVVEALMAESAEFRAVWADHEVRRHHPRTKRLVHPDLGVLEVNCQTLMDVDESQGLLVFTASPGSESAEKLALLAVLGQQVMTPAR
jgi:transcriptional regulator with XRE-family HTH domain